jgi:radical SAM protein with 4Fe4S-binding SPASM domain
MVELSGKGDPIAHPQLTEVVQIIKGAGLDCALVTNGTIPRKDLARTLVERGLNRLNVSLNAGSREVYLKTCGRDLYDKAIAFLREVLERRRAAGSAKPWVRVSNVLCRDNARDIENMVAVMCELKIDQSEWLVMGELPTTGHLQLEDADVAHIMERIPALAARLEEANIGHDLNAIADDLRLRHHAGRVSENPLQRKIPCYDPWMFVVIQPDGVVVPCCYCEEEKLGNVFDSSFADIWFGPKYVDLRRRSMEMPKTGRWICEECFTTCNRAGQNLRIHNKTRLIGRVQAPAQSN